MIVLWIICQQHYFLIICPPFTIESDNYQNLSVSSLNFQARNNLARQNTEEVSNIREITQMTELF